MFADLDETIRRLLIRDVPLDPSEVDVNFEAPDREWSGRLSRPTINCFLYDVRENHELRETDWEVRRVNGIAARKKSPLRIDATYQLSAWARAPEDEHRLLWRVLVALAKHPLLPDDLCQGMMKGQSYPVPAQVAQPEQAPRNPADLWQVIDNRIRPTLTYVVTVALDLSVEQTAPLVFTRLARLRRRRNGQVDDDTEQLAIGGKVHRRGDAAEVIPGAVVVLRETGEAVTTDDEGRFRIPRAPRGPITLLVRAPGRREVTRRAEVPSPHYDLEV
ncbi:MAG: Pvc16 family protein [Chloroflexota bacterium]